MRGIHVTRPLSAGRQIVRELLGFRCRSNKLRSRLALLQRETTSNLCERQNLGCKLVASGFRV